jgi:hypothetical protein
MVRLTLPDRFVAWLNDRPDETVLRALFGTVLAATVGVVTLDAFEWATAPAAMPLAAPSTDTPSTGMPSSQPLPAVRPRTGERRAAPLRQKDERLKAAMSFELVGDGRLMAIGGIEPGTSKRFADEIEKRGSYVKTIVLHSPGGTVQDALAMGRLIRERKFATEVEASAYCASSCPLVFAGGHERRAGERAAIGVHQVFAAANGPGSPLIGGDGMASAQRVSAECQRYLRDMGVDQQVWVHAMETPKDELFYFKPDELVSLKLATTAAGAPAPTAAVTATPKS